MKKRILSLFLATLMIVGCIGTFAIGTVAAGEFALSVVVEKVDNDTVHVVLNMANNPGVSGIDATLSFDKTVIRPVSVDTNGDGTVDTVLKNGVITTNVTAGLDLATLDVVTFLAFGLTTPGKEVFEQRSGKLIGFTFDILDPEKFTEIKVEADVENKDGDEVAFAANNSSVGQLSLDDVSMTGKTVTYNGQVQSLQVDGLDSEMSVKWTNNNKVNAGEYEVTAVVSKAGYNSKTLTATLIIEQAPAKLTGVELWPAVEGSVIEIKSVEAAAAEALGKGYPVVFNNATVVNDGGVYKVEGVTVANTNIVLTDTTVEPTFVNEEALVDAIIAEADIDTDMPVDPRVSKLPALNVDLPYGYELELVANEVVAADGSFEKTEEAQIVPVTYNVVDASGAKVGEVVVTYTIPKKAEGTDLAMLILYYYKLMEEKNNAATVKPTTPVVETSVTLKADAANIKYMDGRGDKFEPEAFATRYEVIKALANVFDIKTTNAPLALTDVDAEYKELVDKCTAAGIIKGYDDKTFRGNDNITRAEVATMICNIMGLDVENAKDAGFSDVSGWAAKYVNACANAKLVNGNGDGTFAPENNIKRNELTVIINNITGAQAGTSCSYADVVEGTWYFGYVAAAAK